jgi:DNA-binding HxlR family transcriptional regulator
MGRNSAARQCCPAEATMVILGGKWRVGIIDRLRRGTTRFNALRADLPGITQKMLTQQLRHLQRYGIVERRQLDRIPPHVEYSLTPLGKKVVPLLAEVTTWAKAHVPTLEAAATKYDAMIRKKT